MRLESIRAVHLLKRELPSGTSVHAALLGARDAFFLDTCQRSVWICSDLELAGVPLAAPFEVFSGLEAYQFLLRVTCGLESQVLGETDIFGQVKEAWKNASIGTELRTELAPWIQRIFEDTKEIRSRHLQNLGGSSYGTLVRKMLKEKWNARSGKILLVGAGQLAQSVAPYLTDYEILILNRSKKSANALASELQAFPGASVRVIESAEEEEAAWKTAAHAVICIPADPEQDKRKLAFWKQGPNRPFIHLGGLKNQVGEWSKAPGFHCLEDVFELQRSQGDVRSIQLTQALRACDERSKLRALGGSVSIHHGWEDLAVFA